MKWFRRYDVALIFFGLGALACLLVSIPATSAAMDIFHGTRWGWVATSVFEIGAVGLELMSLAIPQWRGRLLAGMLSMLAITTAFNYATGIDNYIAAQLQSGTTYAQIRAADYGWLLTIAAAALFPTMLGMFLLGFTARARMVRAKLHTPMAAVAFWAGAQWLEVAAARKATAVALEETAAARQVAADRELSLAEARRALADARRDLAIRPEPETIEVVYVAKARLTWQDMERLALELRQLETISQTTIRRRVAALTASENVRRLPEFVDVIEQE